MDPGRGNAEVGAAVGLVGSCPRGVGINEGTKVGAAVGLVGIAVGAHVGALGAPVGTGVGKGVGAEVGESAAAAATAPSVKEAEVLILAVETADLKEETPAAVVSSFALALAVAFVVTDVNITFTSRRLAIDAVVLVPDLNTQIALLMPTWMPYAHSRVALVWLLNWAVVRSPNDIYCVKVMAVGAAVGANVVGSGVGATYVRRRLLRFLRY